MAKTVPFRVVIEQDEDGVFVASVPSLPGCHTQGQTYEEAIENVKEAIELCLEVAKENEAYSAKVDWTELKGQKTKFLGITEVPITFHASS